MPIKTECQCGARFAAPDKLAGKRVKCPKCAEPVKVAAGPASGSAGAGDAIAVACQCGKSLRVPPTMAGKAVKCPECGEAIRVAVAVGASSGGDSGASDVDVVGSLLDEVDLSTSATGRRCPKCRNDLGPEDVICIQCGFNVETGKQIKTKRVEKVDPFADVSTKKKAAAKSKEHAPPAAQSLAKLLNQAGTLILLIAFGVVAYGGYQAMQADPAKGIDALITFLTESGLFVIIGALLVGTMPYMLTANLVLQGNPVGRVLSIILGIIAAPLGIGVLIAKLAFSDTIARYCR